MSSQNKHRFFGQDLLIVLGFGFAMMVVAGLCVSGIHSCSTGGKEPAPGFLKTHYYTFESFYDGDTFYVSMPSGLFSHETVSIRLIGVDCPEMDAASDEERQAAQDAASFTKDTLEKNGVNGFWLVWDENSKLDKYGRLLAYVWLDNPPETLEEMRSEVAANTLNGQLLAAGHAVPMSIEPHTTFADIFEELAGHAA